jgi:hypothetical protein
MEGNQEGIQLEMKLLDKQIYKFLKIICGKMITLT